MNMTQLKEWTDQEIDHFNKDTQDKRQLDYYKSVKKLIEAYEGGLYDAKLILSAHANNGRVKEETYTLREVLSFFAGALSSLKAQRDGAVRSARAANKKMEEMQEGDMFLRRRE